MDYKVLIIAPDGTQQEFNPQSGDKLLLGNIEVSGALTLGQSLTPPAYSSNQANLYYTGLENTVMLRLSGTSNFSVSGIQAPNPVKIQMLMIVNIGGTNITLSENSGSSLAENRLLMGGNKNMGPGEGLLMLYDDISLKWRVSAINV